MQSRRPLCKCAYQRALPKILALTTFLEHVYPDLIRSTRWGVDIIHKKSISTRQSIRWFRNLLGQKAACRLPLQHCCRLWRAHGAHPENSSHKQPKERASPSSCYRAPRPVLCPAERKAVSDKFFAYSTRWSGVIQMVHLFPVC